MFNLVLSCPVNQWASDAFWIEVKQRSDEWAGEIGADVERTRTAILKWVLATAIPAGHA